MNRKHLIRVILGLYHSLMYNVKGDFHLYIKLPAYAYPCKIVHSSTDDYYLTPTQGNDLPVRLVVSGHDAIGDDCLMSLYTNLVANYGTYRLDVLPYKDRKDTQAEVDKLIKSWREYLGCGIEDCFHLTPEAVEIVSIIQRQAARTIVIRSNGAIYFDEKFYDSMVVWPSCVAFLNSWPPADTIQKPQENSTTPITDSLQHLSHEMRLQSLENRVEALENMLVNAYNQAKLNSPDEKLLKDKPDVYADRSDPD